MIKLPFLFFIKIIEMNTFSKITVPCFLALVSSTTFAQTSGVYAEVGYTMLSTSASVDGGTLASDPTMLRLMVGTEINENLALEGMAGFGMSNDEVRVNGISLSSLVSTSFKVRSAYGIFIRPKTMLNDSVELFGRLGYTKANYSMAVASVNLSDSESGFSYGVGASYKLTEAAKITVDYTSYVSDVADTDGITFGLRYSF